MSNPFRKLPAHSPITAFSITAYNAMIDLLNEHRTGGRIGGSPQRNLVDWDQSVFRVRNDTGRDLWSYDIIGLDGPIWSPVDGEDELQEFHSQTSQKGVSPTVEAHLGKWGVMLEAAENGKIGRCCMSGVVPVRVYVTSPSDQYCDVIAAQTVDDETCYLGTGASGSQILWLDPTASAGDIAWAIVRLGDKAPAQQYYNDTTETIPPFGIAAITGVNGTSLEYSIPKGVKPSSTYRKDYLINVGYEVKKYEEDISTGIGQYQDGQIVKALYNSGTPAVGELWGPTEGQWYLSKGSTGSGDSDTTHTWADWGVIVTGVFDSDAKILLGRIVPYGRARMCLCSAKITSGTSLSEVDGITSMDHGWCPVESATDTLSVESGFETDDDAVGIIVYDAKNNNWRPLDFPCPSE